MGSYAYMDNPPPGQKRNSTGLYRIPSKPGFTWTLNLGGETIRKTMYNGQERNLAPGVSAADYRSWLSKQSDTESPTGNYDSGGGPVSSISPQDQARLDGAMAFLNSSVGAQNALLKTGSTTEDQALEALQNQFMDSAYADMFTTDQLNRIFSPDAGIFKYQNNIAGLLSEVWNNTQPSSGLVSSIGGEGGSFKSQQDIEMMRRLGDVVGSASAQYDNSDLFSDAINQEFLGMGSGSSNNGAHMDAIRNAGVTLGNMPFIGLGENHGRVNDERSASFWKNLEAYKDIDYGGVGSKRAVGRSVAANAIMKAFDDAGLGGISFNNYELDLLQNASNALSSDREFRRNEGAMMLGGLVGGIKNRYDSMGSISGGLVPPATPVANNPIPQFDGMTGVGSGEMDSGIQSGQVPMQDLSAAAAMAGASGAPSLQEGLANMQEQIQQPAGVTNPNEEVAA
jgi:hypothetical protein